MNNSFKYPDSVSRRQTTNHNKSDPSKKDERPLRSSLQITKTHSNQVNQIDNSQVVNDKKDFYDIHISSARGNNKKETNSKSNNEKSAIFAEESKFFIEMNRLLYSKNCIGIYIFLSVICIMILIYSIILYFKDYSELFLI